MYVKQKRNVPRKSRTEIIKLSDGTKSEPEQEKVQERNLPIQLKIDVQKARLDGATIKRRRISKINHELPVKRKAQGTFEYQRVGKNGVSVSAGN